MKGRWKAIAGIRFYYPVFSFFLLKLYRVACQSSITLTTCAEVLSVIFKLVLFSSLEKSSVVSALKLLLIIRKNNDQLLSDYFKQLRVSCYFSLSVRIFHISYSPQENFIFVVLFMLLCFVLFWFGGFFCFFFFLMYLYLIPCFQSEVPSKQPETPDDIIPQKVKHKLL